MVVPIVASICRELFLSVPRELEEGALALGATRWEMVRGVVLSSSRPGIAAALILGLGRALGEAIAVAQVIGAGLTSSTWSLFSTGDTLASRIVSQYQGAVSKLQIASLFYLAAILLVIGLVTNLIAQLIVRRFHVHAREPADVHDGAGADPPRRRAHAPAKASPTALAEAMAIDCGAARRRRAGDSSSGRSPSAAPASSRWTLPDERLAGPVQPRAAGSRR